MRGHEDRLRCLKKEKRLVDDTVSFCWWEKCERNIHCHTPKDVKPSHSSHTQITVCYWLIISRAAILPPLPILFTLSSVSLFPPAYVELYIIIELLRYRGRIISQMEWADWFERQANNHIFPFIIPAGMGTYWIYPARNVTAICIIPYNTVMSWFLIHWFLNFL